MRVICCGASIIPALLAGALVLAAGGIASATPLDEKACAALGDEQARLVLAGVRAAMERGPDWAKSNLAPADLQQVERLIEVEEQIAFRCPKPKPVKEAAETEAEGVAAAAAKDTAKGKAPAKPPGTTPAPKPKAKAKPDPAAKSK